MPRHNKSVIHLSLATSVPFYLSVTNLASASTYILLFNFPMLFHFLHWCGTIKLCYALWPYGNSQKELESWKTSGRGTITKVHVILHYLLLSHSVTPFSLQRSVYTWNHCPSGKTYTMVITLEGYSLSDVLSLKEFIKTCRVLTLSCVISSRKGF